jgi:phosphatidylserine decarboxylase
VNLFTSRTLHEGRWPVFIAVAFLAATAIGCPWRWSAILPAALLLFVLWFFRDPPRVSSPDPDDIVAPADGKVVAVEKVNEPDFMGGEAQRVSIFLSVFDVHVQRAPISARIARVVYQPGKFLDARDPQSGAANEARFIGLAAADGFRCVVRQIAGLIARRIVGWGDEGAQVMKGDRVGMIRFGSRVELYLPLEAKVLVPPGQHVKGGETIVARKR